MEQTHSQAESKRKREQVYLVLQLSEVCWIMERWNVGTQTQ